MGTFQILTGRMKGLEPSTFGTTNRRSNQLSYNLHFPKREAKVSKLIFIA